MSFSLIMNKTNSISSTTNTQFKYNFLSGNFKAENMEMCISSATIPYAFPNVSTYYNNQKLSLIFPTASTTTTLNITLDAGFYTVDDINSAVQNAMITAGLYLVNPSGQNVYFFNITYNVTLYTCQVVLSPVPTAIGTYTRPATGTYSASGTGLPATGYTPQFVLPSTGGINTMIGFPAGTFPATQQTTTYSQTGAAAQTAAGISPIVAPLGSAINSLVARCSFLKNDVTVPSDILDGFPINSLYGSNITYSPPFEKWIKISDGTYSSFILSIVDQDLNTIYSLDPTVGITLLIRRKII